MNLKQELKLFIEQNLEQPKTRAKLAPYTINNIFFEKEYIFDENKTPAKQSSHSDIEKFIETEQTENKFQKLLFEHIDSRNLKDSDVYNKVNIDRRLFSKIRNDQDYHPSKETIILLAISLNLNEDELLDLLNSASYTLPKNNIFDLIIRFCFQKKIYDLNKINDLLFEYQCKTLN